MVKVITITEDLGECIGTIVKEFSLSEGGATAIEYALLAALLGATFIGIQTALGQSVLSMYQTAANIIITAMGS